MFSTSVPAADSAILVRNRTENSCPGAREPPCVAVAPDPTLTTTSLAFDVDATTAFVVWIDPGTSVVSVGTRSRKITFCAPSLPLLRNASRYSSSSPGSAWPPLTSTTVLTISGNSGTNRSIAVVNTPGYQKSPVVWNRTVVWR